MASESSQTSLPSPSPSPTPGNNVGDAFIGSRITLISKFEIRYEGILYHLNVHDSTLGLQNVRSYGTEGRKKDGPQVAPCNTVYDYILFRGNDIKDLQVNPSPSTQSRKEVQSEQDINQSSHSRPPVSSPFSGYGMGRGAQMIQTPSLTSRPLHTTTQHPPPVPLSFQPSSANGGSLMDSPLTLSQTSPVFSMPMPSFVQGKNLAPSTGGGLLGMKYNEPEIVDPFASPIMGLVDDTSQVVTRTQPDIASKPSYSPPLGQAQHLTPPGLASSPSNLPPLSEAQFSAPNSYPIASTRAYDSRINNPNQYAPHEFPAVNSVSAPVIPGPLVNSPQPFFDMELSQQSRQHLVNRGQEMSRATNFVSGYVPSGNHHASLLPLPISAHQPQVPSSSIDLTEEFDFDAMNEKFKKTELWGFLGQNSQRNPNDYREETAVEPNTKPAYNKDDFFDTISCNPLDRGQQQQQNIQFPDHMRQTPEVFGNQIQMPLQPQPGQGAYLTAQDNYRGGYNNNNNYYSNSGYGYYYGGRGRGGNTHY